MSLYSIALFLHIVGALALFALLAVEGVTLREGLAAARFNQVLGPISAVLILFPGLYMMAASWGWAGWVVVGITAWVVIAVLGAFTGIRVLRGSMSRRSAALSWAARVGLALGVVFIMTIKPALLVAIVSVLVAGAAGFAAATLLGNGGSLRGRNLQS